MKTIWVIILIFIGIVLITIGVIGYTAYQGYEISKIINDEGFQKDFEELVGGDCDKLPKVEDKIQEIKIKVDSGCKNPLLKYVVEKYVKGITCSEIGEKTEEIDKLLSSVDNACSSGEFEIKDVYSCNENSDCVLVKTDCCSCLTDVTQVASINKNFLSIWNFQFECADVVCTLGCPDNFIEAKCIDNICTSISAG